VSAWWRRLFGRTGVPDELQQRIRKSFEESAADEDHFPSTIDPRILHVRVILETLGDLAGKRVLDAGCGKGRFGRALLAEQPGASIHGLDIAMAMLAHVRAPLVACAGSLTALPYRTASFDAAYATESLEHAVDIESAVAELCRVVKPGGRIIVIDKNREQWGRLKTPEWERWFTQRELETLLGRFCRTVSSRPISYWDDVEPDGLFLVWIAGK
jgi:malonyl-CoA O-methyltransferase